MLIDQFLPSYDFNEVHRITINAPTHRVYDAIWQVTAPEIALFRELMGLRALPARVMGKRLPMREAAKPLLEQVLRGGFVMLDEEEDREVVVGTIQQFWKLTGGVPSGIKSAQDFLDFNRPDYGKAALNFHLTERGGVTLVQTETRISLPTPATRRKFRAYWLVIRPGSALIRRMWLRALKRRAERAQPG